MGCRLVVGMLRSMGHGRRGCQHGHQQQTRHQREYLNLSSDSNHDLLPNRSRLHRSGSLNTLDRLKNLVFRQQTTLEIFLHDSHFINKHTHG